MAHIRQRKIAKHRCNRTCQHRSTRSDSRHVTSRHIVSHHTIPYHIMPYRITSHYSTCYHMIKQKSNCKSHETIAKQSNTYSFHSHHTNSIRKHQIFVAVTPSSSSNATLILNASQHRHSMQEMAGKQVPTRFKPRPHHLTPSTSRSRRTQLKSLPSCGLSARRAVDGRRRPISARYCPKNLRRRGGGDVNNHCKIHNWNTVQ